MKSNNSLNINEEEVFHMMGDTSKLFAENNINSLSVSAIAFNSSNSVASNVEFWNWMQRNYGKSGIFNNSRTMNQYISQGAKKEAWMVKQLQGKGYEWDWMQQQRNNIKNIFNQYDAGDVANRAASDITKRNIITGKSSEYQMKAYTSKTNPHLKNTPKDMTVVTNSEKVSVVKGNGYENVQEFQNKDIIKRRTDDRLKQIKDGSASPTYNIKNVGGAMAKSGAIGCVIGVGTEAIFSYQLWKNGELTDQQYLKEILKAGGNSGITAGATTGVMMPVSAAITAAGMSSLITIPVAFVFGAAIDSIVAPCFGRGKYREILNSAKYYRNLESIYKDLVGSMESAAQEYTEFALSMKKQDDIHQNFKNKSMEMNRELKSLYDSI